MEVNLRRSTFWNSPATFFLLTFLISWTFLFAAAGSGQPMGRSSTTILFTIGAGGPFLVGSGLALFANGKAYRHNFLRRIVDFKRIRGWWWAVTLLLFPALNLAAITLAQWLGFAQTDFSAALALFSNPAGLLSLAVFLFFFGPFPEELGWRGYAQERLNRRVSPLAASLMIGVVWAAWHVPMYLIPGSYQNQWGFLSQVFWIRCASIVLEAMLMGWVFTQTNKSTLAAILIHFTVNFSGELLEMPLPAEIIRLGLLSALVLLLILFWKDGRQRLAAISN
jgi:membrane protease YdiL (CAAX protease family)